MTRELLAAASAFTLLCCPRPVRLQLIPRPPAYFPSGVSWFATSPVVEYPVSLSHQLIVTFASPSSAVASPCSADACPLNLAVSRRRLFFCPGHRKTGKMRRGSLGFGFGLRISQSAWSPVVPLLARFVIRKQEISHLSPSAPSLVRIWSNVLAGYTHHPRRSERPPKRSLPRQVPPFQIPQQVVQGNGGPSPKMRKRSLQHMARRAPISGMSRESARQAAR